MLWFKNEDRLIGETQSFDIIRTNDAWASVRWIKENDYKEMIFSGRYENCVAALGYIQATLVKEEDTIIDLSICNNITPTLPSRKVEYEPCPPGYVNEKIKETLAENEVEQIEDKAMDFLKENQGKFMTYEDYKNKDLPKVEKKTPIISTKEELIAKLHEYRRANGWNITEVAQSFGFSVSTVWGWFKGKVFPREKRQRDILAKALNVRFERDM